MTEEEKKALDDYHTWKDKHDIKRAIKAVFEKDSYDSDLKDLPLIKRYLCIIKVLICLLLKRTNGSYCDVNKFQCLAYDEHSQYYGIGWTGVWVSPYMFKDWNVCICEDSSY